MRGWDDQVGPKCCMQLGQTQILESPNPSFSAPHSEVCMVIRCMHGITIIYRASTLLAHPYIVKSAWWSLLYDPSK